MRLIFDEKVFLHGKNDYELMKNLIYQKTQQNETFSCDKKCFFVELQPSEVEWSV